MPDPPGRKGLGDDDPTSAELLAGAKHKRVAKPVRAAAAAGRKLRRGDVLGGRFRILRFVASGGMGEIYEAEDLELQERVALKTVRPDIALDAHTMERFRSETQLARKVTHPNVCRTFDIDHDTLLDGTDVTFVTMQLLEGETLAERLKRSGRLSLKETLPLVQQMAAGLGAAHEEGIVHRDFKPANVILVPAKNALRPVVTDFGLAHSSHAMPDAAGAVMGTPDYMAPEQVEGGSTTPATDVYALGLVIYEMLTGARPFSGDTPAAAALQRLSTAPVSPLEHVHDLDPRLVDVILRCLQRNPSDRFASAPEVARAVAGAEPGAARTRPKRRTLEVAAATVALLLAAGLAYRLATPRPASGPTASRARKSVALVGFKNLSGRADAAWLSTALAEMLSAELGAADTLRIIPGESVARMRIDLALPETESLSKETLQRVRRNLGTDLVVIGSYVALSEQAGSPLRVDVRLQDAAAGESVATVSESGSEADLLELVARAGARLRQKLGVSAPPEAKAAAHAALPETPEATRLYAEGLSKLRLFDALGARILLERAVAADPAAPLLHSALAEAWTALGHDARARDEARKAFELAGKLSREERLLVEARACEAARHWPRAIELYGTLYTFAPDDLDYGLALARVQTSASKGHDALSTLDSLRKPSAPAPDDPRIDIGEAAAAESLGDFRRMAASAERAAANASSRDARLLVARARTLAAAALGQLGDYAKAMAAGEEARRIYVEIGDQSGLARVLNHLAIARYRQGDLAAAKALYEQSLEAARAIGDRRRMSAALNNLAIIFDVQGDLARARTLYEQGLAIDREVADRRGTAIKLLNIGSLLTAQGLPADARPLLKEGLAIRREIGDKAGAAYALEALGSAAFALGELGEAKRLYTEALPVARESGEKSLLGSLLKLNGDALLAGNDPASARTSYAESLAVRDAMGARLDAAETRLALARLAIEEGSLDAGAADARAALAVFAEEKVGHDEALARSVLALALLGQGASQDAQDAVAPASAATRRLQYVATRLAVMTIAARVKAAASGPQEGVTSLEAVVAEASRRGLAGPALEARLAQAEIEMGAGNPDAAEAELLALERDARAGGFGLVADKAAALRGSVLTRPR